MSVLPTDGVQRRPRGDEQCLAIRAADDDVGGALGDGDLFGLLAGFVEDGDLTVGDVDVAGGVGGDVVLAALGEDYGGDEGAGGATMKETVRL
jgi:hypothetical protein